MMSGDKSPNPQETTDANGSTVLVGSRVRALEIDSDLLRDFADEQPPRLLSMIGQVLLVYEVDAHGRAWVERWWHETESQSMSHSIALDPGQMEVVIGA